MLQIVALFESIDVLIELTIHGSYFGQGAIMAVGASTPTVVATGNGLFGVKNRMTVMCFSRVSSLCPFSLRP